MLDRLANGDAAGLLEEEAEAAAEAIRMGESLLPLALAVRAFDHAAVPLLAEGCATRDELARTLAAVRELGALRLEALLRAQEDEAARRLVESQEQAARAMEQARDLARANDDLRRSEKDSRRRAEQVELLGSVFRSIAGILEPERLMQAAAETIQARMNHNYVAVVVLDDEGVLVGRWAGRPGVGRRSAGRAQGPAGGIIGRALRKKSPQVVDDVAHDAEYHADVPGTRSEMVIPLLEGGEAVGAIDFQAASPGAVHLDDVAVGETLADYLVAAFAGFRQARRSSADP
jgi:GAF domain-containing protein